MRPLNGARKKVVRAEEHLRALNDVVESFIKRKSYRPIEDRDPKTGTQRRYAVLTEQPPPEIPLVIGDVVHNLRSALDHGIFEVASRHASRPLTHRQEEGLSFPIFSNAAKFNRSSGVKRTMELLPTNVQEFIKGQQPYNTPPSSRRARVNDLLCVLQTMWNADKHRSLLVTAAVVGMPFVERIYDIPEGVHRFGPPVQENGSVVLYVQPGYDANEYFQGQLHHRGIAGGRRANTPEGRHQWSDCSIPPSPAPSSHIRGTGA